MRFSLIFSVLPEWIHCERREGGDGGKSWRDWCSKWFGAAERRKQKWECSKDQQPWVQGAGKNPFYKYSLYWKVSVLAWERAVGCLVWRMLLSRSREHHLVTTGLPTGQGAGQDRGHLPAPALCSKPAREGTERHKSIAGGEDAFCGMQIVLSPWSGSENYFNCLGLDVCLDFGECLTPLTVPFPGAQLHISMGQWVWAHPRAGELDPVFPRMEFVLCPQTGAASKPLQAWKRSLQHPQRHNIPRVRGSGGLGSRAHHPWAADPAAPLGTDCNSFPCFTVKPLIVRPFLWWGELLPLCEQIHWYFHQGLRKTGN